VKASRTDAREKNARFGLANPNRFPRICQSGGSVAGKMKKRSVRIGKSEPFPPNLSIRRERGRKNEETLGSDWQIRTVSPGFVNPAGAWQGKRQNRAHVQGGNMYTQTE